MSTKDDIEIAREVYDETCKALDEAHAEAFDLLREAYKAHEEAVTGSR